MEKKPESKPAVADEKKEEKRVTKTVAEKIWDDIKNVKLEMFTLPNQLVNSYCEPIAIEPSKLYLKFRASAVLPALEVALKDKYLVEAIDRYICVSHQHKKF